MKLSDRKPIPRPHRRSVFGATLMGDRLEIRRGVHVRTIDKQGGVVSTVHDKRAWPWAKLNLGDVVILIADAGERAAGAIAKIVSVYPDGKTVRVELEGDALAGEVAGMKFSPRKNAAVKRLPEAS